MNPSSSTPRRNCGSILSSLWVIQSMTLWLLAAAISTNSPVAGDAALNWEKPERAIRQGRQLQLQQGNTGERSLILGFNEQWLPESLPPNATTHGSESEQKRTDGRNREWILFMLLFVLLFTCCLILGLFLRWRKARQAQQLAPLPAVSEAASLEGAKRIQAALAQAPDTLTTETPTTTPIAAVPQDPPSATTTTTDDMTTSPVFVNAPSTGQ
jgi:hypothetical protein